MDGIFVIDKPANSTSHDMVSFIRRLTGVKKVGHTGTLDPLATGVLPLCIGKATRLIEFINDDDSPDAKAYECTMLLGIKTDTLDVSGDILSDTRIDMPHIDREDIESCLAAQIGELRQIPPDYAAIKYKGRKLYEYARAGEAIPEEALKARAVTVTKIEVRDFDGEESRVSFYMECSKGTYVRSICRDVGNMLGCGAVMQSLRRVKSGVFDLSQANTPEVLQKIKDNGMRLPAIAMDESIGFLPMIDISEDAAKRFSNGIALGARDVISFETLSERGTKTPVSYVRVYSEGAFMGVAIVSEDRLKPYKVINV